MVKVKQQADTVTAQLIEKASVEISRLKFKTEQHGSTINTICLQIIP